jgi:hypothetical protein
MFLLVIKIPFQNQYELISHTHQISKPSNTYTFDREGNQTIFPVIPLDKFVYKIFSSYYFIVSSDLFNKPLNNITNKSMITLINKDIIVYILIY